MLWAIWNGDELQNMWHGALYPISWIMGPIMMYIWVWVSNNLIHNQFLAIIADGYIEQTKVGFHDWLEKDIKDPEEANLIEEDSDEEEEVEHSEEFLNNVKRSKLIKSDAKFDQ